MQEEWREIAGWPQYQVSNCGRVKSLARLSKRFYRRSSRDVFVKLKEKILVLCPFYGKDRNGIKRPKPAALLVGLQVDYIHQTLYVHRLVLEAFVGPCPEGMEGCHIDGDGTNNRLDNLRWDTHVGNVKDSIRHGTFYPKRFHGCYNQQGSDSN